MDMPAYEFVWQVSTHSRLKAAGCIIIDDPHKADVSTHSRLKAAGSLFSTACKNTRSFQHTAA